CLLFLYLTHRDFPSFPTRRSSDLADIFALGDAIHVLGLEIAFKRSHFLFSAACTLEVFNGVIVNWEKAHGGAVFRRHIGNGGAIDRKSTRLNSSHVKISYAVFCLK